MSGAPESTRTTDLRFRKAQVNPTDPVELREVVPAGGLVAACPFCGGVEELEVEYSEHAMDAWILCGDCLACGPVVTVGCRDEEDEPIDLEAEAFDAWSARTGTSLPELGAP